MKKMLKKVCLVTLLVVTAGMGLKAQNPDRLADMGQLEKARDIYLKMYNMKQFHDHDLYYKIGTLYINLQKPDSAALFFKEGTEADQKDPLNWIGLAEYYYLKNDSVQALSKLKIARQFQRNNPLYYMGLAEMYMEPGINRPDLARTYLDKAIDLKSSNSEAYILRGDLHLSSGHAGDAANEYKQAMYFDKKNPVPYYKAGIVYAKGRIYQEAISSMEKAIACDSTFVPAWREMGEIYLLFGKYRQAHEAYSKYISLIRPDYRDLIRYASILVLDKDFEPAAKIIDTLKTIHPEDPKLLRIEAYADFETGQYGTGLAAIQDFFRKADKDEPIASDYEYYANLLKANKQDSLAIPQLLKAIDMDSTRRPLLEQVAKTYEGLKDYPDAAHYYELNLANKENVTQVDYFKIGWLYYLAASNKETTDSIQRVNEINEASRLFTKVCEMSPTNYLGWFWKARTQALLDPESELGLARPFYEKALEIMNTNPDKYKKEINEALKYLGYFYYLRFYEASKQSNKELIPVYQDSSAFYWDKVLTVTPGDKQAEDALKALKKK